MRRPRTRIQPTRNIPGNTFLCGSTGSADALVLSLLAFSLKYRGAGRVLRQGRAQRSAFARGRKILRAQARRAHGLQSVPVRADRGQSNVLREAGAPVVKSQEPNAAALSAKEEADISRAVSHRDERSRLLRGAVSFCRRAELQVTGDNSLRARLRKWLRMVHLVGPSTMRRHAGFRRSNLFGYDYTEFLTIRRFARRSWPICCISRAPD